MELANGMCIDGQTEIDDLALVMHIAQNENERLRQLEALRPPPVSHVYGTKDNASDSESDDSGEEFDSVYRELQGKYTSEPTADKDNDRSPQHQGDPALQIDNLRIIDTVDLPSRVAEHFPIARVGECVSVVGKVVVVQCTEPSRILDLGSIVCLRDRRIIGTVSDTFGNTGSPFHMVISNEPSMVAQGDEIYYDVKHSTLVTDVHVIETASSISSGDDSDEECNPAPKEPSRGPVKLKQYYNDLESH